MSFPATRFRNAALFASIVSLGSNATAGDYGLVVRGTVSIVHNTLPAPFDSADVGDKFHMIVSVLDQPDLSTPNVAAYPIDLSTSILTLDGAAAPLNTGALPPRLTLLDNLDQVGDRIAVTSGTPWGSGVILAAIDDASEMLFNQLDIGQMLGLRSTVNGGVGFRLFGPVGLGVDVTVDEFGFVEENSVSPNCLGDGSAAACPCANPGNMGQGCANSTGAGGLLSGLGSASLSADNLGFWADQLPPTTSAILFSGRSNINSGNGIPFGAGRRCAGRGLRRLGMQIADSDGRASWDMGVVPSGVVAGQTVTFQVWYADSAGACMNRPYNCTQALDVVFAP